METGLQSAVHDSHFDIAIYLSIVFNVYIKITSCMAAVCGRHVSGSDGQNRDDMCIDNGEISLIFLFWCRCVYTDLTDFLSVF